MAIIKAFPKPYQPKQNVKEALRQIILVQVALVEHYGTIRRNLDTMDILLSRSRLVLERLRFGQDKREALTAEVSSSPCSGDLDIVEVDVIYQSDDSINASDDAGKSYSSDDSDVDNAGHM